MVLFTGDAGEYTASVGHGEDTDVERSEDDTSH